MFEQLFERPAALARQRGGPMVEERRTYLSHLASQGYARRSLRTVARFLIGVAEALHLAERPGEPVTRGEIETQAARWTRRFHRRRSTPVSSATRPRFVRFATGWLRFMGRLQVATPPVRPFDDWVRVFADDLRHDRGLNAKSVSNHGRAVRDFLGRVGVPSRSWHRVGLAAIEAALVQKFAGAGYARSTIRHYGEAVRAFLRFAEARGWCRRGLADGILMPRIYQQERIPAGPSWAVVQRLIAQADGDRPNDFRDRAVLMLLAVYGLRAGEVARLRLEDIDWDHDRLHVTRPKCGRSQTFPLCRSVGSAILRYLRQTRPRSPHRAVFLHGRAPYVPLASSGVTSLVSHRFAALGLRPPHCGAHALRHACATHLLERGLTLKEIGDHLGHQHPEATRVYTKVDVKHLRIVADIDLGGLL